MVKSSSASIPLFLINLARAKDRLEFMRAQFDRLELSFTRLEAVDGRLMSQDDIERFRLRYPLKPQESTPNASWIPGSIGCFLSHRAAWQTIVDLGIPYGAIFEDDVHISPAAVGLLRDANWIPSDADLVRLETVSERVLLRDRRAIGNDLYVARLESTTGYTGAYIISQAAARAYLEHSEVRADVVDMLLFSKRSSPMARRSRIYQITPSLVIQDNKYRGGNIGAEFPSLIFSGQQRLSRLELIKRKLRTATLVAKGARFVPFRSLQNLN